MDDPYTLPDEDPFSLHSVLQHVHQNQDKHKRSSLLESWINSPPDHGLVRLGSLGLGSSSNPYLAYPDLPRPSCLRTRVDSSSSYDLVEDDDIPLQTPNSPRSFISFPFLLTPPRKKSQHTRSASSSSTLPSPRSLLPNFKHSASQSLSTLPLPPLQPPRPSFSSSTSSLRTPSSTLPTMSTSTFDSDSGIGLPETPTKSKNSFFSSLRMRAGQNRPAPLNDLGFSSSKDTLSSISRTSPLSPKRRSPTLPNIPSLSNITDIDIDEDTSINNLDFLPPPSHRFSRSSSHTSVSASSSHFHLPTSSYSKRDRDKVYFSSLTSRSGKKKRKLIVSGIGASEVRKFEGVKRWCESFGELRSITRLPNGDLQIDFRDPDVADTVCRVRAKVFIAGVGSVQLSWIVGNKR